MQTRLRIGGVPEHFNLPWHLALEGGAFDAAGLQVEFSDYPGGTGAMAEALREDSLDAALMLTEGAALDIFNGGRNRLVRIYVESPLVWGIHVAAQSRIDAVSEGLRVAISRYGSGSHLIAVVDAIERGFDHGKLRFVTVDTIDGARAALSAGRADIFLWEKHMTQPLVDSGEFRRIGERVVPWPAFAVSARREFLAADAESLAAALDIAAETAHELKARHDAAETIAGRYGITSKGADDWLRDVRWAKSGPQGPAALDRVIAALSAQGAIDATQAARTNLWHRSARRTGGLSR